MWRSTEERKRKNEFLNEKDEVNDEMMMIMIVDQAATFSSFLDTSFSFHESSSSWSRIY